MLQLDLTCPVEIMMQHFPVKSQLPQCTVTDWRGQKSRVAFAVLCGHSSNFLVLGTLRLYCYTNFTLLYFRRADQSLG